MSSSRSSIDGGDVEVPVDDHVEDRPEQEALVVRPVLAALAFEARERVLAGGRHRSCLTVADREQPTFAEHDVDFVVLQLVADEDEVVQRDVVVVGEALELGALVRVDEVFGGEVVDPELLGEVLDLLRRRVVAVDPQEAGLLLVACLRRSDTATISAAVPGSRKHHAVTVMRGEPTQHRRAG